MRRELAAFEGDVMAAIDRLDASKADNEIVELVLAGDAYREKRKAALREIFAEQGETVDEAVLDRTIDKVDRERFAHVDRLHGATRLLALLYVRRGAVAAGLFVVLALGGGWLAVSSYQADRVREAEVAQESMVDAFLAERERQLSNVVAEARDAGAASERLDAVAARAGAAIEARDTAGAVAAIAELDRMAQEERRLAAIGGLSSQAEDLAARAEAAATAPDARAAIVRPVADLEAAAAAGNEAAFGQARRGLEELVRRIETPLVLRIVDRGDEKSGFRRTPDDGGPSIPYIVVEAIGPDGQVVPQEIRDFETGRVGTVPAFAVQVSSETFARIGDDKRSDGVVDERDAGAKPAGTLAVDWSLDTNGNAITAW